MIIKQVSNLREKCENVNSAEEADKIIALLEAELDEANKLTITGVGLAASQIGINKRVAIVRIGDIKINLINAKIINARTELVSNEGCLSLPTISVPVKRFNEIQIENGLNKEQVVVYGFAAVVVQHEMDHFDGKLIIDHNLLNKTIGDNEPCPCGKKDPQTNKVLKFKKCCKKAK